MQTSLQCGAELIYGASADRAAQSGAPRGGGDSSPAPPADGEPDTGTEQTHTLTQPLTMVKYLQMNMQKQP